MPSRMIKIHNMEYYPLEGGKRRSAVMEPRYSVKLSLLVEEFGLKKVYTPPDFDNVRIVTPDLNRPGMQLVGFFSHFDKIGVKRYNPTKVYMNHKTPWP